MEEVILENCNANKIKVYPTGLRSSFELIIEIKGPTTPAKKKTIFFSKKAKNVYILWSKFFFLYTKMSSDFP